MIFVLSSTIVIKMDPEGAISIPAIHHHLGPSGGRMLYHENGRFTFYTYSDYRDDHIGVVLAYNDDFLGFTREDVDVLRMMGIRDITRIIYAQFDGARIMNYFDLGSAPVTSLLERNEQLLSEIRYTTWFRSSLLELLIWV